MRVLVLNASPATGGAAVVSVDVTRGLAAQGVDVHYATSDRAPLPPELAETPTHVVPLPKGRPQHQYVAPRALRGLRRVIERVQPDVVHAHNLNVRTFSAASLLLARRVPTVWTIHDLWPVHPTGWPALGGEELGGWRGALLEGVDQAIKQSIYAAAPVVVASPCEWMRDQVRVGGLARHRHVVVRNGIDPDRFRPDPGARARLGIPDDGQPVLLFSGGRAVGGVSPAYRKGWDVLVAATHRLGSGLRGAHLIYVGDPIPFGDVGLQVHALCGRHRDAMAEVYAAADVFVLPTRGDNAPLTVLEAMASGAVVVASEVGGIPEVIREGETGFLCAPDDPAGLARAIERALSDPARRARVAAQSRRVLETSLSVDAMVRAYRDVYETLA